MPSIVPNDIEEMIMHAAKIIAIKVGEELLEQRDLLPTAYEWFTSEVTQMLRLRNQSIPNTELNHIASPQWLRSQISCLLKQHVAYFCKIKKYGTVLCRYRGDLHSLNVALGQQRLNQQVHVHHRPVSTETKVAEHDANELQSITKDACRHLNDKLHMHISNLIKQDSLIVHDSIHISLLAIDLQ